MNARMFLGFGDPGHSHDGELPHGAGCGTAVSAGDPSGSGRFHAVQKSRYVEDIKPEDTQLLEGGKLQKLVLFEGPRTIGRRRETPVEVILLFDVRLSVIDQNLLDPSSLKETLLEGLGDGVGISVYAFAGRFKKFTGPTRDPAKLKPALDGVRNFGHAGSPIFQVTMRAAHDAFVGGDGVTSLIIIFCDGEDITKTKAEEAAKLANSFGIQLYPVALGHHRLGPAGGESATNIVGHNG